MRAGKTCLEYIDEARFLKAWESYERYRDKPEISFVDLTSMAVMEELGLKEVFTGDRDFDRVGRGFILLPG